MSAAIFDDGARNTTINSVQESRTELRAEAQAREIEEIEFLVSFRCLQNRSRIPDEDDDDAAAADDDSQTN